MELKRKSILEDRTAFEKAGYRLPGFDHEQVLANTESRPEWVHFGAGNIFRAFQAGVCQELLDRGIMDTGLIAVEGYDYEIIEKSYRPHDNLSILATLKSDATVEKTVIGSIVESLILDRGNDTDFKRLKEIFSNPSLKMASFTITEKGYAVSAPDGSLSPAIAADLSAGPDEADSYLGKVFALLYERYKNGALPIAMVSMDNCSHNGDKLRTAAECFAKGWTANGFTDEGFVDYVLNSGRVSYPWSMIDKITPRPDSRVEELLAGDNIIGLDAIVTSKKTWVAPFVNAEECQYLVIEDDFPNGMLPLDKGGIIYTDRETVDKVERMKVCTCLNPLHTTLAVFGCLLGYTLISEEMKDPLLRKLVEQIGYVEGLPVVVDPGIIDPKAFIDEVVNVRIPNPFMPDTPQRIACDTSQKLPIRFGETIKAYVSSDRLDVHSLKYIPLVYAGWFRYLMSVDDEGRAFELSPDPMLDELLPAMSEAVPGMDADTAGRIIDPLLENDSIFGVNLKTVRLDGLVKEYFAELTAGPGAVRATLDKYVSGKTD